MASNAEDGEEERERMVRKVMFLFRGRFSDQDVRNIFDHVNWNMKNAVNFIMESDPREVRSKTGTSEHIIRELKIDPETLDVLQNGIKRKLRQFACEQCDRVWWRTVPVRKMVSQCKVCKEKYDPVPREFEWGWAAYHCDCGRDFSGSGQMNTTSPCYTCGNEVYPKKIQPYRRRQNRKTTNTHFCNAPDCTGNDPVLIHEVDSNRVYDDGTDNSSSRPIDAAGSSSRPIDTAGSSSMSIDTAGSSSRPIDTVGSSSRPIDTAGSSSRPIDTAGSSSMSIDTAGSSSRPIDTVGSSSRPIDTAGSSSRPIDTAGSSSMSIDTAGSSSRPIDTVGSSSRPIDTAGSSSRPIDTVGSSSRPIDTAGVTEQVGQLHIGKQKSQNASPSSSGQRNTESRRTRSKGIHTCVGLQFRQGKKKVIYPSDRHNSTGSTIGTFLSQGCDDASTYVPSLSSIPEHTRKIRSDRKK